MRRFKLGKYRPQVMAVLSLLILLVPLGLAFASGGGGEEAAADSGAKLKDLGYRFLNFALLVIIIFVVVRKTAIKDFFANRREEIKKKFEDLQAEKDSAEKRYQELEQKLKDFEKQKQEIIEQFKAEGTAEKEKIIAQAQERAKYILEQADLTIQREMQAAKDKLKQDVVDAAAQRALEIISEEIKDTDQDQLVEEFIERVGKGH